MPTKKKTFTLPTSLIHQVTPLPEDKAGILLKAILNFVNDNEEFFEPTDLTIKIIFEPLKEHLNRHKAPIINLKLTLDERKSLFADTLKPYISKYGRDMLNDFYRYWTEPNKSKTKFKQELEQTWDLERRLDTWSRNDRNFNNKQESTINYGEKK